MGDVKKGEQKMNKIIGANAVAEKTQGIDLTNGRTQYATKVAMYYNMETRTLYTEPGPGREKVCDLLNPCTAEEIVSILSRWLWI